MASVIIHNLPEAIYRALQARAAAAERSIETEILLILENSTQSETRVRLGSLLAEIGHKAGGVDLGVERDRTLTRPTNLE